MVIGEISVLPNLRVKPLRFTKKENRGDLASGLRSALVLIIIHG